MKGLRKEKNSKYVLVQICFSRESIYTANRYICKSVPPFSRDAQKARLVAAYTALFLETQPSYMFELLNVTFLHA